MNQGYGNAVPLRENLLGRDTIPSCPDLQHFLIRCSTVTLRRLCSALVWVYHIESKNAVGYRLHYHR